MEAIQVSHPQPLVPYPTGDGGQRGDVLLTLQAMIEKFVALLQELKRTMDRMEANMKSVELGTLETFKERSLTAREEHLSAQKTQGWFQIGTGSLAILMPAAAAGLGRFTSGSVAMLVDSAAHLAGPAGNAATGFGTILSAGDNYQASEAEMGSTLATQSMQASSSSAQKTNDEAHRVRDDYLSQMRALYQELTAILKASVR